MSGTFNPFDPEFVQDPYPTYANLRKSGSVGRVRISPSQIFRLLRAGIRMAREQGGFRVGAGLKFLLKRTSTRSKKRSGPRLGLRSRIYTVSRFAEVSHVLRHPEIFSSEAMGGSSAEPMNAEGDIAPTAGSLIGQDPPEHTRQRNIVNRGFTPRRMSVFEPEIRKNAEELFAKFESRGRCDLMEEFANPLPVSVIADLLGLDPSRRDDFKRWSTALIVGSTKPGVAGRPNVELFREFRGYMTEVIEERRQQPGDDLISLLVTSGEGEGILDPQQVVSFASLMLAAGSETTTNLIGNAMLALFNHPDQLARVRADPSLISNVVEETLRYDSPIQLVMRIATRDSEVGGTLIPKGSLVAPLIASANRDEGEFDGAERFDIDREQTGHLAFGFGNHFCIGTSLARLEGATALEMILTRLQDIELDTEEVERHGSFLVRGPSALPVRFKV